MNRCGKILDLQLRLFLDASKTCARLWVRQGCAVGAGKRRQKELRLRGRLHSRKQADQSSAEEKSVGFDLNQMWLRAVTCDKFFDFEPTLSCVIFAPRQDGEKSMDQSEGFSQPVRYALSFAFAVAASLLAALAFGGLPWPF
jgi:hypothetical protein